MFLVYSYSVTADLGQAHFIFGKLGTSNELMDAEVTAIHDALMPFHLYAWRITLCLVMF